LLLLSDFSKPRRRQHHNHALDFLADGEQVGAAGDGEDRLLTVGCLPWCGWGDRALGTIGGGAEATFETLRTLAAFDGDWLEVSVGTVKRLVRVRAVVCRSAPDSNDDGVCHHDGEVAFCEGARHQGVIYLRRPVLEKLLGGGSWGGHCDGHGGGTACLAASNTPRENCGWAGATVNVRRYAMGITRPSDIKKTDCDDPGDAHVIATAKRVSLSRVARHDSSSTRSYAHELRSFFDGSAEPLSKFEGKEPSRKIHSMDIQVFPRVVALGDIFGVWVCNADMKVGGGAISQEFESDSDDNDTAHPDVRTTAPVDPHPVHERWGQCGAQGRQVLERPGHHLIYFQVTALEAATPVAGKQKQLNDATEPVSPGMVVDVSRTLVCTEAAVNAKVPGVPLAATASVAAIQLVSELADLLRPAFHPRTAALDLRVSVLLHGKAGAGKTSVARCAAAVLGLDFLEANCATFVLGRFAHGVERAGEGRRR